MEKGTEEDPSRVWKTTRRIKYISSVIIYYSTFSFAAGFTILGPTIVEFSHKFHTDVSQVSIVFSFLTGSYLVGALMNGILSNFINRQVIVITLLSICSLVLFLIPHMPTINMFYICASFLGFAGGGYDSSQLAWIIDVWRREAAPFILTQHFFFSLGTIVPPLLLSFFLTNSELEEDNNKEAAATAPPGIPVPNPAADLVSTRIIPAESQIWIPFTIAGGLIAISVAIQITFSLVLRVLQKNTMKNMKRKPGGATAEIPARARSDTHSMNKNDSGNSDTDPGLNVMCSKKLKKVLLICLSCSCLATYQAMEQCTLQFLPTFAHFSKVALTTTEGARLLGILTSAFCACRGVGIFLVLKFPPHFILCGNIILLIVSNIMLVIFADVSKTGLLVSSIFLGCGLSTTFPAFFAYIQKYLFISDAISASFLVCGGGLSAMYPIIVGHSVERNPSVLIYTNGISVIILATAFALIFWLTHVKELYPQDHDHDHDLDFHGDNNKEGKEGDGCNQNKHDNNNLKGQRL